MVIKLTVTEFVLYVEKLGGIFKISKNWDNLQRGLFATLNWTPFVYLCPKYYIIHWKTLKITLKFIRSETAKKFCEILTLRLTVCTAYKSNVKISQNFVAFSEYMNFTMAIKQDFILYKKLIWFSEKKALHGQGPLYPTY